MNHLTKKTGFKQRQSVNYQSEPCQCEDSPSLEKSCTELKSLQTLYETLPCIYFTLNSTGAILAVSQFGAAYLGYDPLELIQKPIGKILSGDDQEQCQTRLTDLPKRAIEISQWETRLIHKNGDILWVRAVARLVPGTTSNALFSLVCEDVTASKEVEATLRESEKLYRSTLSTISDTVLITNHNGAFTFICPNVEVIFGYSWQEVWELGNITKLLGEPLFEGQALETCQEIRNIEREIVDKSGRRHTLLVNVKRVSIKEGTVLYSCRDITERKEAEEELRQYRQQLECRIVERTTELIRANERLQQEISERQQAQKVLQKQFMKERLLGAIAQRIHHSLNLEAILNTTVGEVRQVLECDRVIIFHLQVDGSGVVVVESVDPEWIPISGTVINDRYFAQDYIQLYQQGRVQAVEDIYNAGLAQCHVDLLAQFQVRANLVVPIVQEEKLWGLLVAQHCKATRQWQPWEISLLTSLATHTAIAIQQSELYQQAQAEIAQRQQTEAALRQQFQREQLMGAIAQRIRQSLKLEEILERTVAEVRQVLQTDRVIIFQFEPDWSGNVVVESVGDSWPAIRGRHIYDPCFEKSYRSPYPQGRIKTIEDIYTANLSPCYLDLLTQFQVRANLIVPLLNGEQLWGLLIAHHCSEPRKWQQGEIDLLCSLASQVAIAIQHSQLYEQAKSLFLREQAINHLTQAIRCSLDLPTIFSTATEEIEKLLQVDRTQILQYLPERKLWVNVAESGKDSDLPVGIGLEIPDQNNPIAERLKRLEVIRIDDTNSFEDETNKKIAQKFPGAWLLVPLHCNSSVWGALGLVMEAQSYHWQDSEVELITALADQLAIALQQAELYKQSRTAEAKALTQAQKLEQALEQLQTTQSHLVQTEKMSSLGQLVAGVAHEINNPVNFIYGNLIHAGEYTQDLMGLLQLYQQHYSHPIPEIEAEIEAIDLDFLIEDLPKLLDSMKVGAERICEIVYSLRNFSRIAEAEMKTVDIHEGIDSTLMILRNRLKNKANHVGIQVIKDYSDLPDVECYAGQLNQVFMNLLINAIDAIDEYNQTRSLVDIQTNPSIIRVQTELLNDHDVVIRIADNGPGMTEQVKQQLFDPFFTTKAVGVGTGLGLSISYQIVVEKHGGQLYCQSQLGQGTEFFIQIPLRQNKLKTSDPLPMVIEN